MFFVVYNQIVLRDCFFVFALLVQLIAAFYGICTVLRKNACRKKRQ
jgi:hypothetical protein